MKGVNIFIADGFEDIEAIATGDVLRRAGIPVRYIGISDEPFAVSAHGVTVGVDLTLEDLLNSGAADAAVTSTDVMIFPGGMPGTRALASCGELISLMKNHYAAGGSVAAICAAPGLVLGQLPNDVWKDTEFTCFDGFQDSPVSKGGIFVSRPAIRSGRIISGRSAGHAVAFGLEIVSMLLGEEKMQDVRHSMMLDC